MNKMMENRLNVTSYKNEQAESGAFSRAAFVE